MSTQTDATLLAAAGLLGWEFPDWEFTFHPGGLGVVAASWTSEDGRHMRYVVCRTSVELLERLRQIRDKTPSAH